MFLSYSFSLPYLFPDPRPYFSQNILSFFPIKASFIVKIFMNVWPSPGRWLTYPWLHTWIKWTLLLISENNCQYFLCWGWNFLPNSNIHSRTRTEVSMYRPCTHTMIQAVWVHIHSGPAVPRRHYLLCQALSLDPIYSFCLLKWSLGIWRRCCCIYILFKAKHYWSILGSAPCPVGCLFLSSSWKIEASLLKVEEGFNIGI